MPSRNYTDSRKRRRTKTSLQTKRISFDGRSSAQRPKRCRGDFVNTYGSKVFRKGAQNSGGGCLLLMTKTYVCCKRSYNGEAKFDTNLDSVPICPSSCSFTFQVLFNFKRLHGEGLRACELCPPPCPLSSPCQKMCSM